MSKRKLLEGITSIEEQVKIASSNNSRKIKYLLQAPNLSKEAADILIVRLGNSLKKNKLTQIISDSYETLVAVGTFTQEIKQAWLTFSLTSNVIVDSIPLSQKLLKDETFQKLLPGSYVKAVQNPPKGTHYLFMKLSWKDLPRELIWETYEALVTAKIRENGFVHSHSALGQKMFFLHDENSFLTKDNIEFMLETELTAMGNKTSYYPYGYGARVIERAKNALLMLNLEATNEDKRTLAIDKASSLNYLTDNFKNEESFQNFAKLQSKFQTSKFLSENFLKHKGDDFPTDIKTKLTEAETHTQKALSFYETILKVNSSEQTDKALKVAFTQAETAIENYERVVDFIIEAAEVETENDVKIRDSFDDIIVKTRTWSEMKKFELS